MERHLQLAPMQAMTDIFFMNTYHRIFGGFSEMMAPYLMASSNSPIKIKNLQKYFAELNDGITLIPQLLSNDSKGFLHVANSLYDLGYEKINWNLGCPFPFVTKKQRGAGLLPFPDKIQEILEDIEPFLKPKLSIKVRLGLMHSNELLPLIDIFNDYPITELIVHPRTAEQKYEGLADKELFGELFPKIKMPVIYNGDILRKEQVYEIEKDHPEVKGFMIGRGAFINPFITNQINNIEFTIEEKKAKFLELYFELHNHYKGKSKSDIKFLNRMKELWWYFAQSFEKGDTYLFALKTINQVDIFEDTVKRIFENGKLVY